MRNGLFFFVFVWFCGFHLKAQENDSIRFLKAHFREKQVAVYFVPVNQELFHTDLGDVETAFSKAKIYLDCFIEPTFKFPEFQEFLNPPADSSRYSQQMKALRNAYFEANPGKDPEGIYCFVIPKFKDTTWHAFSVPAKSLIFVVQSNEMTFHKDITRHIGYALGLNTTSEIENIMSISGGSFLNASQAWQLRSEPFSFSLYDDYEFVRTNNGLAAYCIWLENDKGEIAVDSLKPIESIFRPYKRNYLSYLLKIDNPLFWPLFAIKKISICPLHLLTVVLAFVLVIMIRKRSNKRIVESKFFKRQYLRFLKFISWCFAILIVIACFWGVNWYYENSVLRAPHLKAMKGKTSTDLLKAIGDEQVFSHIDDDKVSAMTYVKKGKDWYALQEKKVLLFDLRKVDSTWKMTFSGSTNILDLPTLKVKHLAYSHYLVFRYFDAKELLISERVYNHLGIELTQALHKRDPAKRILLFVNGYRPVSTSNSFEHNLADIQKKGVEYPETKNYLYSYDRYNYWRPWNEIDVLFQERINPAETWYADGHHSVSTSNHFSLVQFAQSSSMYPLTCNGKKHTCQYTIVTGNKKVASINLLDQRPNTEGFAHRRNRGHIAGKNLRAILNELPNVSENDTLYIVAHSMGYAYALGILDEMRGKIQLGNFYILAPENAASGKVNINEWKEVWQYGTKLYGKGKNAPCEQDGVAPQTKVGGLKEENRIYFPSKEHKKMGFFKSHFIGYYTWVLDIPKGERGAILQR